MAEERTAIIVKEIRYWKEHRLLPERYCDYLLALYTNGQELSDKADDDVRSTWTPIIIHFILLHSMIPFSFLVVYFTEFLPILQLSILTLFCIYSILLYVYFHGNGNKYVQFPLFVSLLLVLLLTLSISNFLASNSFINLVIILVNFILWLFLSIVKNIKILQMVSILSIVFAIGYIIFKTFTA
ncbi:hypothetical protein ACFOUV_02925 [Oceanobacillus longus]|uniref:Yip1 domain-containing protein n=1 Tax=Oceanobacillus longus TaxID=930120 RepID=A0ABV8GSQ5_9BACI